eukprot:4282313-Pyramimonas_sp.AAC.1
MQEGVARDEDATMFGQNSNGMTLGSPLGWPDPSISKSTSSSPSRTQAVHCGGLHPLALHLYLSVSRALATWAFSLESISPDPSYGRTPI